jgi:pimeloyl-ACP methyl ester carboxylesterase
VTVPSAARAPRSVSVRAADVSPAAVRRRIRSLPARFLPDTANGLAAEWELRIDDEVFAVSLSDHECRVREGPALAPATVITTDRATWLALDEGSLASIQAFLESRLAVRGNLDLAVRLQTMFRPPRGARRATDLQQVEFDADGMALSCYLAGKGEPLVLLHGLGASKISWLPLMQGLADRHRVVVPDLPGHGESDKPRSDYSPRFYAHAVRCLLDAVEVDRAVVVGNSMGGRIGLELALRSPNRVGGLVLLDAAIPGLAWRYVMGLTRVFPTGFGAVSIPLRRRWMETALRRLFAHPERLQPEALATAADEFIRVYADPRARTAFLASLRQVVAERPGPFWGSMRRVRQPALVVVGDRDRLVPTRLGIRLAENLPNAELLILPEVGHVPQFEAPEETLAAVRAFLDRLAVRAGRAQGGAPASSASRASRKAR